MGGLRGLGYYLGKGGCLFQKIFKLKEGLLKERLAVCFGVYLSLTPAIFKGLRKTKGGN